MLNHLCRISTLARALLLAAFAVSPLALHAQKFSVQQRWVIGGEGSWDYLVADAPAHRLYIAHLTKVDVVDTGTGKLVGAIQGLKHCHGIVIPPHSDKGFISDGGANQVVVFKLGDLSTITAVPAGTNPDGMVYEPTTNTLWAFNGGSRNATVIDVASLKPVATLPLNQKPEFPVTDGDGQIFVNLETNNSIDHIDAHSRQVVDTWKLKNCTEPSGLAIDTAGKRLFSVCDGHMAITDYTSGKSLGNARVGDGPDATAFDPHRQLAYASNEDGTLSIIDTAAPGFPVKQLLPTMKGARTMAFDPSSGRIYIVSAKLGPLGPPLPGVAHNRPPAIPGTFTVLVIGRN